MRHSLHPNSERAGVHDNPSEVVKASSDIWLNVSLVLLVQPGLQAWVSGILSAHPVMRCRMLCDFVPGPWLWQLRPAILYPRHPVRSPPSNM
jgi:hypothetical protein